MHRDCSCIWGDPNTPAVEVNVRNYAKEYIMKRSHKIAASIALSLSLGLAGAAFAHPGGGWGPQMRGPGYGMMGAGYGPGAQLVTPEERAAFQEKMANAATPEERQALMAEHRAEVQKRAAEKGLTLGQGAGPRGAYGPRGGGYGPGAGRGFGPGAGPCWTQGAAQ